MELPPEDALRWIVQTYAHLRAEHAEALSAPTLVQPTGEYFPDRFQHDAPSVERLLRRMMAHSPLADDLGIELAFLEPAADHAGGCGSAACGPGGGGGGAGPSVQELEDGYRVFVAVTDVANPDVLTASLARAVGALVLHEAGEAGDEELGAAAEIAAAACGLGVILANGSAVWAKGCHGLKMAQATLLSVEETAVALALFAAVHGVKPSSVQAHLGTTQREALDTAWAWVESNPSIVRALRDEPVLLASGLFSLEPVRGLLGRWLHKRQVHKDGAAAAPASAPVSDERRRRIEEARALVDEVLGGE